MNFLTFFGSHHEKCVFGYVRIARPRSACTSVQSDQGLCYSLTESLNTTECINGEQIPRDFVHAQDESESVHFVHVRRQLFAWRGQFA